jgi:signal transduction histidine kinase
MTRRIVTRLRRYRRSDGPPSFWSRLATRAGAVMLALGVIALGYGLYDATYRYASRKMIDGPVHEWQQKAWSAADRVERSWQTLTLPPPFRTGDEPEVKAYLQEHPLIVALHHLKDDAFWIRRGDRLVPGDDSPESTRFLAWTRAAAKRPVFQWFPPDEENPDHGTNPIEVLITEEWVGVKRWEIGCPSVERMLQNLLKPDLIVRLGIKPETTTAQTPRKDWGKWPNLQADPARLFDLAPQDLEAKTNAFGEGFTIGAFPTPADEKAMNSQHHRHLLAAGSVSTAFITLILLGVWVRSRLRRRALLESDRLASLAHSLKTPLAILKFRCDSLRLGRLNPEQSDEQLMRLGQEVDHLTVIIDSSLRAIKGDTEHKPVAVATPLWIQEVATDLEAAFETEGREMRLDLCPEAGEAVLASLRSALLTLLENGLEHGQGLVHLSTRRHRNQLVISVADEGPGLDKSALNILGRPFQRLRESGSEGFQREGLGLGLSLLFHTAEQEGWGLAFSSEMGQSTTAELRIPLARGGSLWERMVAFFRQPVRPPLEQH